MQEFLPFDWSNAWMNHFENHLEEKARNREDREQGRKKNDSAIKIQKQVRGFICRRRLEKERLADAKAFMEQNPDWSNLQNKSIFIALRGLLFKYDKAGFPSSSDWLIK